MHKLILASEMALNWGMDEIHKIKLLLQNKIGKLKLQKGKKFDNHQCDHLRFYILVNNILLYYITITIIIYTSYFSMGETSSMGEKNCNKF